MKHQEAVQANQEDLRRQNPDTTAADRIKITYYTDPLCCWSWALQPHWKKLLSVYTDVVDYHYVMVGMIPDWSKYNDPLNAVTKPIQMGPVWMHAGYSTNTPINYNIWIENPPTSSYPSCIAVKAAMLQSLAAGELYLDAAREAVMLKGMDISNVNVLAKIAARISEDNKRLFDHSQFIKDYNDGTAQSLFRQDLQQVAYQKIGRYPTITFTNDVGKGLIITGYRPFDELAKAMEHMLHQ